jgi:hypothetical protein
MRQSSLARRIADGAGAGNPSRLRALHSGGTARRGKGGGLL